MSMEVSLRELAARVGPLERVIAIVSDSLREPDMFRWNTDRGFRYSDADIRHFCLLKAVRVVSALNAGLKLARGGYIQEIGVLLRTIAEFTTHIEFVIDPNDDEKHKAEVEKYLRAFFSDGERFPGAEIVKAQVRQGFVHESLGKTLDKIAEQQGDTVDRVPAATLYSNTYRIFSNYVHGKYPEIMDLYGGTPGRFHLQGMSGTPKDSECVELLATFITTATNTFVLMIQGLNLRPLIEADAVLGPWYRGFFDHGA